MKIDSDNRTKTTRDTSGMAGEHSAQGSSRNGCRTTEVVQGVSSRRSKKADRTRPVRLKLAPDPADDDASLPLHPARPRLEERRFHIHPAPSKAKEDQSHIPHVQPSKAGAADVPSPPRGSRLSPNACVAADEARGPVRLRTEPGADSRRPRTYRVHALGAVIGGEAHGSLQRGSGSLLAHWGEMGRNQESQRP